MPPTISSRCARSISAFRLLIPILLGLLASAAPSSAQVFASPGNAILQPGQTQTFTITVPSGTTLASYSVLTFGAPNRDFTSVASGTSCPNVISGACTVEVQFQPTVPGRRQGVVLLSDPSGNMLLSASLDGAGSGPIAAFSPSIISTFAGGGSGGSGGPATSAQLSSPAGVAIDGFGNYYVADQKANKVWKITPAGTISTFAGTGTAGFAGDGGAATSAELNGPMDVIVDGAGYVYISDTKNNVVRMVNTAGVISTYAGQYYPAGSQPPAVCSAATNSVGDGCPGNQIILNTPVGLVFCHAQNLHIADKLDNRVRTINRIGYNTFTQVGDGAQGYNGDGELNTSAELNGPTGLDMDAANYIYVADSGNHIIRKTLLTGTTPNPIATVAGTPGAAGNSGDGGSAISAQLNSPSGVRVDPAGNIYVSDSVSEVVRKINVASGMISTVAGTGTAGFTGDGNTASSAELNSPLDIAVDEKNNVYIADSQNGRVRKVDVSDPPSLAFATTAVGSISPAQDVTVMNLGTSSLNITQVNTTAGYSLGGKDTSCSSSGSEALDAATSCILGIEFTPQAAGSLNGSVILTDNANPPMQTIALTGSTTSTAITYTLTSNGSMLTVKPGADATTTLGLSSKGYAGTVSFTTSVTSTDGTPADITATASSVTLTPGGSGTSTLTIAANQHAANHTTSSPWGGGSTIFLAALLGIPFAIRRKGIGAMILFALAIPLAAGLMACSGSTTQSSSSSQSSRSYVVTVTPTAGAMGTATVTNPAPVNVTVVVQ